MEIAVPQITEKYQREWRNRPLEAFYPVVFFRRLRVNIQDEGHVGKKAVYLAPSKNAANDALEHDLLKK